MVFFNQVTQDRQPVLLEDIRCFIEDGPEASRRRFAGTHRPVLDPLSLGTPKCGDLRCQSPELPPAADLLHHNGAKGDHADQRDDVRQSQLRDPFDRQVPLQSAA